MRLTKEMNLTAEQSERMKRTLECAEHYINRGWPVLPLYTVKDGACTCPAKSRCPYKPGKHPYSPLVPKGSSDASIDPDTVRRWFGGMYNVNIGIVAGKDSGLLVLDVDPRDGGDESLKRFGKMPQTPTVETGGVGQHYYLKHPGGDISNSASKIAPGLDVKAKNNYVVAPPSLHISGNEYKWILSPNGNLPLADCPEWIYNGQGKKKKSVVSDTTPIKEGARNNELTSIAGAMRKKGCGYDSIYAALDQVNESRCEPPLDNKEVERIAQSISKYEPAKKSYNLTDLGNAERFADRHGDKLLYVHGWDRWLYYDGTRWNGGIGNEMAQRKAVETIRSIVTEAQDEPDEVRKALIKWSLASESTHRINAMLTAAKALEKLSAYPKDFDKNPMLFNCVNGTIDLRTGELLKHNPDDMITMFSPVKYNRKARLELWDKFLDTATNGDKKLKRFLQIAIGYSIIGNTVEEKLFFIHGPTATSKSTFLEAITAAFGDYATTADFESFLQKPPKGDVLRNDIAALAGKRFVKSIEVSEGRRLAEGLIKILTGGDRIRARFLYQEGFEFMPQFTLWLAANHEPKVSDNDDALWRRIVKVPFTHAIPKEDRDPTVKVRLRDPAIAGPAILAWAVQGCLMWQKEGLQIPESVEMATENYRLEQDPLKEFYEELLFEPEAYIPVTEMRKYYVDYARDNGFDKYKLSVQHFNERLETHGCERKPIRVPNDFGTIKPTKCWAGVTLASNPKRLKPEQIKDEIPF